MDDPAYYSSKVVKNNSQTAEELKNASQPHQFQSLVQSSAQSGEGNQFFEHIFRQGRQPPPAKPEPVKVVAPQVKESAKGQDPLTLQHETDIKELKESTHREIGQLYDKFQKVISKLRRGEAEDWELKTKRLRDSAALIKEQGDAITKRNGNYIKKILQLIDEQKDSRREHKENLERLKAEEQQVLQQGDQLSKRVQDNVNILKAKILEYEMLEQKVYANLTKKEKAQRKRAEFDKLKAIQEEEEREKKFEEAERQRRKKEREILEKKIEEAEKKAEEAEQRIKEKAKQDKELKDEEKKAKLEMEAKHREEREKRREEREEMWDKQKQSRAKELVDYLKDRDDKEAERIKAEAKRWEEFEQKIKDESAATQKAQESKFDDLIKGHAKKAEEASKDQEEAKKKLKELQDKFKELLKTHKKQIDENARDSDQNEKKIKKLEKQAEDEEKEDKEAKKKLKELRDQLEESEKKIKKLEKKSDDDNDKELKKKLKEIRDKFEELMKKNNKQVEQNRKDADTNEKKIKDLQKQFEEKLKNMKNDNKKDDKEKDQRIEKEIENIKIQGLKAQENYKNAFEKQVKESSKRLEKYDSHQKKCDEIIDQDSDKFKIEAKEERKGDTEKRQRDRRNRKKQIDRKIKEVAEKGKPYKHYEKHFDWRVKWLTNWGKRKERHANNLFKDCQKKKDYFDKKQSFHNKKEKDMEELEKLIKAEHEKFDAECTVSNISSEGKSAKMFKFEQQKEKRECDKLLKLMRDQESKIWYMRRDLNKACNDLRWSFDKANKKCSEGMLQKSISAEILAERDGMVKLNDKDIKRPDPPGGPPGRFWSEVDPYANLPPLKKNNNPKLQTPSNKQFTKMILFRMKYWDRKRDIFWYAGKFWANSLSSAYNQFIARITKKGYYGRKNKREYFLFAKTKAGLKMISNSKMAGCVVAPSDKKKLCRDQGFMKRMFNTQVFYDDETLAMIGLRVKKRSLSMGTRMWGPFKNEVQVFGHRTYFYIVKKFGDKQYQMQAFDRWKEAKKTFSQMGKKGYVGVLMQNWKWGKRMIYYVKKYAIPKMSKNKAERAKWEKGKYFKKTKRYAQKVLGQFLMEVKAGVVLPVFDPQTIDLPITTKEVDDDDKFDKKAPAAAMSVHENFPLVPNSKFAMVDTDNDGKAEKVPINRPKDLKKSYFPKAGLTEIMTFTPSEPTTRFDPENPTAGSKTDSSSSSGGNSFAQVPALAEIEPSEALLQEFSQLNSTNSTANTTLAQAEDDETEVEEKVDEKDLDETVEYSESASAKIDEEGASDADLPEVDDTDPDEKNDEKDDDDDDEPNEADVNKVEGIEEKETKELKYSESELKELNEDEVETTTEGFGKDQQVDMPDALSTDDKETKEDDELEAKLHRPHPEKKEKHEFSPEPSKKYPAEIDEEETNDAYEHEVKNHYKSSRETRTVDEVVTEANRKSDMDREGDSGYEASLAKKSDPDYFRNIEDDHEEAARKKRVSLSKNITKLTKNQTVNNNQNQTNLAKTANSTNATLVKTNSTKKDDIVPDSTPYFNRVPVAEPRDQMKAEPKSNATFALNKTDNATLAKGNTTQANTTNVTLSKQDNQTNASNIAANASLVKANGTLGGNQTNATLARNQTAANQTKEIEDMDDEEVEPKKKKLEKIPVFGGGDEHEQDDKEESEENHSKQPIDKPILSKKVEDADEEMDSESSEKAPKKDHVVGDEADEQSHEKHSHADKHKNATQPKHAKKEEKDEDDMDGDEAEHEKSPKFADSDNSTKPILAKNSEEEDKDDMDNDEGDHEKPSKSENSPKSTLAKNSTQDEDMNRQEGKHQRRLSKSDNSTDATLDKNSTQEEDVDSQEGKHHKLSRSNNSTKPTLAKNATQEVEEMEREDAENDKPSSHSRHSAKPIHAKKPVQEEEEEKDMDGEPSDVSREKKKETNVNEKAEKEEHQPKKSKDNEDEDMDDEKEPTEHHKKQNKVVEKEETEEEEPNVASKHQKKVEKEEEQPAAETRPVRRHPVRLSKKSTQKSVKPVEEEEELEAPKSVRQNKKSVKSHQKPAPEPVEEEEEAPKMIKRPAPNNKYDEDAENDQNKANSHGHSSSDKDDEVEEAPADVDVHRPVSEARNQADDQQNYNNNSHGSSSGDHDDDEGSAPGDSDAADRFDDDSSSENLLRKADSALKRARKVSQKQSTSFIGLSESDDGKFILDEEK